MVRHILIVLCVLSVCSSVASAQSPRLIIRGDDMGFSHSGNLALIDCYKNGIEKTIEVLVPSPWFPEAVQLLKENPGVDVGIHLDLSSEWDNVKWRPLTYCPTLTDSSGYFLPMIWKNPNYPGLALTERNYSIEEIEKEFRAQIELALRQISGITHLSGHMGCTYISEELRNLTSKLAKEYNLDLDMSDVKSVSFDGPHETAAEKIQSFSKMLDQLNPGETYLFLEHPGLDDVELQAIHHIGYENVAMDRQGVSDLFRSPAIRELIRQKGIVLISYGDLTKPRRDHAGK